MPWTYWNGNYAVSPSMRREWIEMNQRIQCDFPDKSPSMRREWIEIIHFMQTPPNTTGLPPCGGSGLKFRDGNQLVDGKRVSLHAEGVD